MNAMSPEEPAEFGSKGGNLGRGLEQTSSAASAEMRSPAGQRQPDGQRQAELTKLRRQSNRPRRLSLQ
jgi:hypothetical protein